MLSWRSFQSTMVEGKNEQEKMDSLQEIWFILQELSNQAEMYTGGETSEDLGDGSSKVCEGDCLQTLRRNLRECRSAGALRFVALEWCEQSEKMKRAVRLWSALSDADK